jgi:hypothetical protein
MRFVLTGTDWLDPSSVRVIFRLNNRDAANPLHLINALPANFFRRLRILAGGQLIEDIDYYNLVYNMLHTLLPTDRRYNDAVEGFGLQESDGLVAYQHTSVIPADHGRVVSFPLLCGLFNQPKYLPLRYLQGLQIELEVVNNFTGCVLAAPPAIAPMPNPRPYPNGIPAMSTQWSITDAQIKCDVVTLDSGLDEEYVDHMMKGKNLPIAFSSFSHQAQAVGDTDRPVISLSRAFTRLKTVFVTFYKRPVMWLQNAVAAAGAPTPTDLEALHVPLRECNFMYHPQFVYQMEAPHGTTAVQSAVQPFDTQQGFAYQAPCEVEIQLQIGSKLFPEMPIRSSAEAFYQLRKAIGSEKPGSSYSMNISDKEYRTTKFIVAFDTEKVHGAHASGMNTRSGDLITLKISNLIHVDNQRRRWPGTTADLIHTTLCYDAILSISDQTCQVLE